MKKFLTTLLRLQLLLLPTGHPCRHAVRQLIFDLNP